MKLKEKLAKEFYNSRVGTLLDWELWEDVSNIIFIAGFEKARELIREEMDKDYDQLTYCVVENLGEQEDET